MGFLTSVEGVIAAAIAKAMAPPPPPDITRWCEDNIEFDERSPMPGPFNIERFAFLKEIHEALSPEHPCREVTVRGSAQWGKTVSIIQPTLGEWHRYTPLDSLVVHPTQSSATEWVNNKWMPMRRSSPDLRAVFGAGGKGDNKDNTFNQETLDRNGSLKVASAGSPADLTGTSRRLIILDDLSKFDAKEKGDPEELSVSRGEGFEDAKILRVSTALIQGTCRVSRAYQRSDQRLFHVPCPHCGFEQPLTWENFLAAIDPENLAAAHFTCDSCQQAIKHGDKEKIVRLGRWIKGNPRGDHPGFHLWRAYSPMRDWASIAVRYAQVMGWTRAQTSISTQERSTVADIGSKATEAGPKSTEDANSEQVFFNDVLGLPYEMATDAPNWEELRDRVEHAAPEDQLPKGTVPADGVLLTAGVDCQDTWMELQVVAFGRDRKRTVVDHKIIPYHISDEKGQAALNAYLKATWKTELGLPLELDALTIDGGTYTDDVWLWAKMHPWSRVIIVKGSSTQTGPVMMPMKFERRLDGKAKRRQKRAFMLNVSQLKGDFYTQLRKDDPAERGYVRFVVGLGDEYYRQITSETRVLVRSRTGVVTSKWELVEPSRRNEVLDTMNYAEAGARRKGWLSMTDEQWEKLAEERGAAPAEDQPDLFDAMSNVVEAVANLAENETPKPRKKGLAGVAYDG